MMRAVVITVPIVDGRPALGLGEYQADIVRKGSIYTIRWDGHQLVAMHIGDRDGDAVLCGVGDQRIQPALAHLAGKVKILKVAWASDRAWLEDHGVRATPGGRPIPPVAYANDNPELLGRDGEELAEGEPE